MSSREGVAEAAAAAVAVASGRWLLPTDRPRFHPRFPSTWTRRCWSRWCWTFAAWRRRTANNEHLANCCDPALPLAPRGIGPYSPCLQFNGSVIHACNNCINDNNYIVMCVSWVMSLSKYYVSLLVANTFYASTFNCFSVKFGNYEKRKYSRDTRMQSVFLLL